MNNRPAGFDDQDRYDPGGWFLGPKGENEDLLRELIDKVITAHCQTRATYHRDDPEIITPDVKRSANYKRTIDKFRLAAADLNEKLSHCAPLFSMRSHGHMLWDQALPATIGYLAGLLYNQNNVAAEASPVTTWLEQQVSSELCCMLGFTGGSDVAPWGHVTCDGSVANIEALWAARNAKFYPIAVQAALRSDPELQKIASQVQVRIADGSRHSLDMLDHWALLNISMSEAAALPYAISALLPERQGGLDRVARAVKPFLYQERGPVSFYREHMPSGAEPVACVPATAHYSWPKANSVLGLAPLRAIPVDCQARMDPGALRKVLQHCCDERVPLVSVIAVIGSTEESAVDPLNQILAMRESYRAKGLNFAVHCDAAWGGYFACSLPNQIIPTYPMGRYVIQQYASMKDVDTITVDPHKGGFVPYPAGTLCYRDKRMRDFISLKSPVIMHGAAEPSVGVFGIEGSKPGAAAASIYLAHKTIGLDSDGYGQIHGKCLWTSKRLYARLLTMFDDDPCFRIAMFHRLPAELSGAGDEAVATERAIVRAFVPLSNDALLDRLQDAEAGDLFSAMGSDQTIVNYAFNFRDPQTGCWNEDVVCCNRLNRAVFDLCSVNPTYDPEKIAPRPDLVITSSAYDANVYGQRFVDDFSERLGLKNVGEAPLHFLISTTMNPWPTETIKGDFLEVVQDVLCSSVKVAAARLGYVPESVVAST